MSAAASWDIATDLTVRGPRRVDGRPDLRLVPSSRPARPRLRLTRFGRLLLTLGVLAIAVVVALSVVGAGAASATIDHSVTVGSGQTLSAIAARELPQVPVSEGVAQIRLANDLSSGDIHVGQRLAIPALR